MKKYNNEENEDEIFMNIKNKKIAKILNKEEIKEIKKIQKQHEEYNEKRLKRFIFNYKDYKLPSINSLSKKNLLDNNTILIRPNILSSMKQILYEKEKADLNEERMQLLIQKIISKNHNENAEIKKRKKDFNNYMENLKIEKMKEKFGIEKKNEQLKEDLNIVNNYNIHKDKIQNEDNNKNINKKEIKRKSCLLKFYQIIWKCLKSPMEPYSVKKKIWAGKNGIFKKEYQDNRVYK